jgi:two-component system, cell cycle response regulator
MTESLSSILLVDDETENLRALERTLRGKYEVTSLSSPKAALEELKKKEFSVVVSDQRMPEMLGTEFLSEAAKIRPFASRIILTAHTEAKELLDAINRAEIYRYITKPWDNTELLTTIQLAEERFKLLRRNTELVNELTLLNKTLESQVEKRTQELKAANLLLSDLAMTDPLTKILNRRAFSLKFSEEIERAQRYKRPICLAMIDVDHFKMYNDMEGHVFGDEALRKIASLLTSNLRKSDALARYGGEEFILMMPETGVTRGKEICERLRQAVENARFQGQKREAFLTISLGIAAFPEDGATGDELTKAADASLYAAKEAGRNRVMYHPVVRDEESVFVIR